MKAFHAYDIRGIYNKDFTKEDVYKIGYFLPKLLKTDKVLVGRDARVSSPEIFDYLCKGIIESGANVYDLGLSTTPMVYYITAKHQFDASVMITASHNSKEYNGLKVSTTNAVPVGYDNGLKQIEELMKTAHIVVADKIGEILDFNVRNGYINFLKQYLPDISNLKLTVDCSNGMAGLFIRELLGDAPEYLFENPDGSFPNHEPNPLVLKNLIHLQQAVKQNNSDIGVIFDGDADRVMFIDENAEFIAPDLMIALMAEHFLKNSTGTKPKVIHDIRTSKSVSEYITKLGGEPYMWKVGRAYAALRLREIDGLFGGELAGHYYFKDFFYSDSGILASLIILEIVAKYKAEGKKVSDIIRQINKYYNSGELNFTIQNKKEAMERLKNYFTENDSITALYDFDGYRIEFKDWWFNIRPSNTEPYLRLLVEGASQEILDEKLNLIKSILNEYLISKTN